MPYIYALLRTSCFTDTQTALNIYNVQMQGYLEHPQQLFPLIMGSKNRGMIDAITNFLWDVFRMREIVLGRKENKDV